MSPRWFYRFRQLIGFAWTDSAKLAKVEHYSRTWFFLDIIRKFFRYGCFSNQYVRHRLWDLSSDAQIETAQKLGQDNRWADAWIKEFYANWRFIDKWRSVRYDTSARLQKKRNRAYAKQYHLGPACVVRSGVTIVRAHASNGKIVTKPGVLIARNADIDYTGDLILGENVKILEGVKILTHAHDSLHLMPEDELLKCTNRAYKTNLVIGDHTKICARAIILPGVGKIGENSMVASGAVVNSPVPANVIVSGNPAKIIAKIPRGVVLEGD